MIRWTGERVYLVKQWGALGQLRNNYEVAFASSDELDAFLATIKAQNHHFEMTPLRPSQFEADPERQVLGRFPCKHCGRFMSGHSASELCPRLHTEFRACRSLRQMGFSLALCVACDTELVG